jgi:carbonic anhydrase
MNILDEMLEYNSAFVENKGYVEYQTSSSPNKKMVILSCMDTRLTELLPKALNIKNGDVKLVKNAGATIMHPFGSILRSIIVAVYEFQTKDILVIGHHGCGMSHLDADSIIQKAIDRGVSEDVLATLNHSGIDIKRWLKGFDSVEESIKESVNVIRNHPLIPKDVFIHGLIMEPVTGKVEVVINGYE